MCAWRYKAGGTGSGAAPSAAFGSAYGGGGTNNGLSANSVSGAGAFLRQNAAAGGVSGAPDTSLFRPPGSLVGGGAGYGNGNNIQYEDEEDEEFYEEEEEEEEQGLYRNRQSAPQGSSKPTVPPLSLGSTPAEAGPGTGSFGQAQAPVTSLAGAFLRNVAQQRQQQAGTAGGGRPTANGAGTASLRKPSLAGLSRQLFKGSDGRGRVPQGDAEDDDDYDDGEFEDETADDREFFLNTRELFNDVDAELLSAQFVPHEHVVGIIANDMGDEAAPDEIDDNLAQYTDLMEEIDMYLGNYIESHHDEFNKAISDFSEMILAVSGSDDTLARLKKDLVLGAASLDTHAEQLRVLRLRAAKSLYMKDTLQSIQDALTAEADVKQLLSGKHYLRAVQQLQKHGARLQDATMRQIRATSGLRDFVEATTATVHTQITDDLLSCVFRQERLVEADAQLLNHMMSEDGGGGGGGAEDRMRGGGGGAASTVNISAPGVRHMVQKYWKRAKRRRREAATIGASSRDAGDNSDKEDTDKDSDVDGEVGIKGTTGRRPRKLHTLAAIVETFYDDPTDDTVARDYLKFIPLCVKSLLLLGKLDSCHEAFFSRATKCIERFIAHFLSLYDAWRRKMMSATTLAGSDGSATVRAIRIRAFDLTNDLVSGEEAIATVQARELRAMLSALFAELEKIVRNADYLVKIVAVARFPFISEFIVQPVPFDAERTSKEWDLNDVPLGERVSLVSDIVAEAEQKVEDSIRQRIAKQTHRQRRREGEKSSDDSEGTIEAPSEDTKEDGRNDTGPSSRYMDGYAIWDQVKEFFSVEKLVARFTVEVPTTVNVPLSAKASPSSPPLDASATAAVPVASPSVTTFTLRDIVSFVDDAVQSTMTKYGRAAADGSGGYGYKDEEQLRDIRLTLIAEITDGVRMAMLQDVKGLLQQWDLHVLWSQLNYHVEFVFHVLCDAKEAEEEGDDLVTLAPFLRQKNLVSRVQRMAAALKEAENRSNEEAPTLDKLLSAYQSSSGFLRMMEETGTISFSLVGAVKKAQAGVRKANEGQARQYQAMQSDTARLLALSDNRTVSASSAAADVSGGVGGANAPLVLLKASGLRSWFIFSAMNVLTCYECAERFCQRCGDRVPEFRLVDPDESVLGFFKRFSRSTYIPTLHAFHSQQLQQLCLSMGDTAELVAASLQKGAEAPSDANSATAATGPNGAKVTGVGNTTTATTTATTPSASSQWPTVTVTGAAYPVLTCVYYVGQVLEKISGIRAILPESLAEDVERSTSEALVEELAAFLKRKVQLLGRGTIQYRLLNSAFEDAFASIPNRRWQVLCDEEHMWNAHRLVDNDLYTYYQLSSAQRTSGHEYTKQTTASLEALSALDRDKDTELDEKIGLIPAQDLCVRDDSSLVALAVLSFSSEWLCEVLLRHLWPGARRYDDYTDSCVPGYLFSKQLSIADSRSFSVAENDAVAHQKVRLSGLLTRLCSLAQVALFYLSVESRFLSFCFLPQLRDESYNIVATSASADTFVQAFARRISKLYMLLRQHISPKKIKYTCLTTGKPASELVMMELAHLRDKAISEAGMSRLRTDLLVLQTALQLILPTDLDVRHAVSRYFARPAIFVRYIPNRDVVNDLLSSGDYRRFTLAECEELIRLVFRQVTGANDDSMARANIQLFYDKLRAIEALRKGSAHGDRTEGGSTSKEGGVSSEATTSSSSSATGDDEEESSDESELRADRSTSPADAPLALPTTLQKASSAVVTPQRPPPLPLTQQPPPSAPAAAAAAAAAAAVVTSPPAPSEDEEYEEEEEEETEEDEEADAATEERTPALSGSRLPASLPRPTTTAASATVAPPTVPPIKIPPRSAPSAPAPPATTAAAAAEESSDEYYYEEVTDDEEDDDEEEADEEETEEEEEEEEVPRPNMNRRR